MTWDQVDEATLKHLYYEENLPDSLIAKRFGVSKQEVTKKRRKYDIGLRQRSAEKALAELSAHSGITTRQRLAPPGGEDALKLHNRLSKERLLRPENIDAAAKALTYFAFRQGPIEDMHAAGQLSQEDMKALNTYMVNHIARILGHAIDGDWVLLEELLQRLAPYTAPWDPARPELATEP